MTANQKIVSMTAFSLILLLLSFSNAPSLTGTTTVRELAGNRANSIPDYRSMQSYLNKAKKGMGVSYIWNQDAGDGSNVEIVHFGSGWNLDHVEFDRFDKNDVIKRITSNKKQISDADTAVLGLLVAEDNGFGITGIAFNASIGLYSINMESDGRTDIKDLSKALRLAAKSVQAGDILLITSFYSGTIADGGLLPAEYSKKIFRAISKATKKGIIVIEAAGDSGLNLDEDIYKETFNRKKRDSGAILVGAGAADSKSIKSRSRLPSSNFGSRIDLQGWGQNVVTTGFGDLSGDKSNAYTGQFGGTTAATAMVAGAAVVLQSYAEYLLDRPLTPAEMREILVNTGSAQSGNKQEQIGPLPNLKRAAVEVQNLVKLAGPRVLKPQAGFNWRPFTVQEIKWSGFGGESIKIDFYHDSEFLKIIAAAELNDGSEYYGLSNSGENIQIKITSNSDSTDNLFSGLFTMNGACPVSSPKAGSVWSHDDVLPVRWDYVTGETVNVSITNRDTGRFGEIASTANDGSIDVVIAEFIGTGDKIFVAVLSNSNNSGAYSPDFTVGANQGTSARTAGRKNAHQFTQANKSSKILKIIQVLSPEGR